MNLKQLMCTSLLLAGGLILGPATISLAQDTTRAQAVAANPFPNIAIPGVPLTGNCCLWQIHKKAQGTRLAVKFGTAYSCETGRTARDSVRFKLILATEGAPCDQSQLIPDNSVLEAVGKNIRRITRADGSADGFTHFIGSFTIKNPAGAILFRGTMEVIDRIGTHHTPFCQGCEVCNQPNHLEGWLVGRGAGQLSNFTLRVLITARAQLPTPNAPEPVVSGSIDGVLIKCP